MLAIGLAAALNSSACSAVAAPDASREQQLLVSAAASLADAFREMETAFEAGHPDIDVILNLGSSSTLREQILEGAPADVYASANRANMEQVVDAGGVAGQVQVFAQNSLQIAVPAGNPGRISGLADFSRPELLIGLCAAGVPCGDVARRALAQAGISPAADTHEPDVRALLTKIAAGELDAGITYLSDVASGDPRVQGIDIPARYNQITEYPIAVLAGAPHAQAAAAFVDFVFTDEGQTILASYGFGLP